MTEFLAAYRNALQHAYLLPWRGSILEANGQALISDGPSARVGEACEIRTLSGETHEGQIVGFERERSMIMLLDTGDTGYGGDGTHGGDGGGKAGTRPASTRPASTQGARNILRPRHQPGLQGAKEESAPQSGPRAKPGHFDQPGPEQRTGPGIRYGDEVVALGHAPRLPIGKKILGRVINARGDAIDGGTPLASTCFLPLEPAAPRPFARIPIDELLSTGVRAIDGLLPIGKGQRIGIFAGSGVGKSTLLGMMTRSCAADIVVIGLVGERGREVLEFLNESLGTEGRAKSVVVVATSDEAPLLKVRAALSATSIAEHFAAQGKQVLLIVDSLTRFGMAMREIGLASGEPPTNKGYTPSVFARMARMLERAGRFTSGSITAIYTVLMEGDDEQDPIVDAVRSFVDGHLMLSRDLALEGWYPPIDILRSVSRLMGAVASPSHLALAADVRKQLALYARSEDLIRIGAYKPGSDPDLDRSIENRRQVQGFLHQAPHEVVPFEKTMQGMQEIGTEGSS